MKTPMSTLETMISRIQDMYPMDIYCRKINGEKTFQVVLGKNSGESQKFVGFSLDDAVTKAYHNVITDVNYHGPNVQVITNLN